MIKSRFFHLVGVLSGMTIRRCDTLLGVVGHQDRRNDIIYQPGSSSGSVIYFGGDVQDLEEVQRGHRDNKRYLQWSLEATSEILTQAFSQHVLVIRPSRMELKTFSCFDNFVESDRVGAPTHSSDQGALEHLKKLVSTTANQLNLPVETFLPVTIIGFSKGVVVLNQILYELPARDSCDWFKIDTMCWLDGGHNGGKETWITNKGILKDLSDSGIKVRARVTPYQVSDTRRPWIKKEEKIFRETLQRLGCDIKRKLYFEDDDICIENHFRILNSLQMDTLD